MKSENLVTQIREILLETVQFTHQNGNMIAIEPTAATEALVALFEQMALEARVEELEKLRDGQTYTRDYAPRKILTVKPAVYKMLDNRLAELAALLGKEK